MPNKKAKDKKRNRLKLNALLKKTGRTKAQIARKKRKDAKK